jgi:ABC-type lipoprotein release transport system permease subunit
MDRNHHRLWFVFGLAYSMTLLTTWLPAVQASKVEPAEALRYE